MKASKDAPTKKKPAWMRLLKPALFIALGIIIAFPLFSISYYTMVRTSTPQFCASCHEIQFAYNTWKTSTHVNNAQGFVADCMDCHLPGAPRHLQLLLRQDRPRHKGRHRPLHAGCLRP